MDAVEIELTVFEQQQRLRLIRKDLAAQLRSDRPARTGYHYHLATNTLLEQCLLRRHCITAKQVRNIHLLDVFHLNLAARQIHKARHTANMQWKTFQHFQNLAPTAA